jgi:hypothetical protein
MASSASGRDRSEGAGMTKPKKRTTKGKQRTTVKQRRFATAYHEAGHATAAFLEGVPILGLELMGKDGALVGGYAGTMDCDGTIEDLGDALRHIFVYLSGEASVMCAWASGMFSDESIGVAEAEGDDLIEHLLATPPGSTFTEASAYSGFLNTSESEDESSARGITEHVCHSTMEAARLISWQRDRTVGIVQTERFLYLCGRLAGAALEFGTMTGEHVTELLTRWDSIFTPTEKEQAS